jgi:Predicted pPIWI-associating nuclease
MTKKKKKPLPNTYDTAVDYITGINGRMDSISNQLSYLTATDYQPSILSAISGMQSQLSEISKINTYLPDLSAFSYTSEVLELSRSATNSLTGLTDSMSVIQDLGKAMTDSQSWYNEHLSNTAAILSGAMPSIEILKASENLGLIGTDSLSALAINSSIAKATELSLFSEKSLSNFDYQSIGNLIGISDESRMDLGSSFTNFSTGYSNLLSSFNTSPKSYIDLNPTFIKSVPVEYFTGSNLLELISTEEEVSVDEEILKNEIQYENEISLNKFLPKIDSGLYDMWKGAIEAYYSNNSDKVRHFATSIRELFTHLMGLMAPDKEIKKWSQSEQDFYNGQPTRKARLNYMCRNVSNNSFKDFVNKDVDATLAFINLFQKGTHKIKPNFSQNQLVAIKSKSESTLKFMLEIYFKTE